MSKCCHCLVQPEIMPLTLISADIKYYFVVFNQLKLKILLLIIPIFNRAACTNIKLV